MASGNFRIKEGKKDWCAIYYRFKQGGQFDLELSTKIQTPKNRWSQSKQEILNTLAVDYKFLNKKIRELDIFVKKEYENARLEAIIIDRKCLNQKINFILNQESRSEQDNEKLYLTNFIDKYIEDSKKKVTRNGKTIKEKTRQHYKTTKNKIIAFEEHRGERVLFKKIDISFHSDLLDFLKSQHLLNNNTIGGYLDDIKLFCRKAEREDIVVNQEFKARDFYSPFNETKDTYLKNEEINKIYKQKFKHDYLDNARDWFAIGLRTGLRISDLLKLKKENIEDEFIIWTTKKTEFPVIIPIHPQVKEILDKRKGEFPRKISDQKFNNYIKEVSKIAGINEMTLSAKRIGVEKKNEKGESELLSRKISGSYHKYELVSSNICRRSFASNLYGKIDTMTIMKITGHKTEREFLKYIKITRKEYAIKLKEFWNKTILDD